MKMLHHDHGNKMISRWKITMVGRFYHSSFHRTCYVTLKITSTNWNNRRATSGIGNLWKEIFAPFSSYTFLVPNDLAAGPRCLISTPFSPDHPDRELPPVFSVLYYVIKVTLHYLMLHRFEIHSALELSPTALLGCCLPASRLCEAARWR